MSNPFVTKIQIYPVKSLDPVELTEAEIGIHSLLHDRAFAMIAEDGRYVNSKRTGRVNQLHASYNLNEEKIRLSERGSNQHNEFELKPGNKELENYLSSFFEKKIKLVHSTRGELMDVPTNSSITIISQASYTSLHESFPEDDLDLFRLRFRANIEIGGVVPYWEEQLFNGKDAGVEFSIGEVKMIGVSPRARCNVPPRNPLTGETDKTFVKRMLQRRADTLPAQSQLPEFGNLYYLSVDTYLPESEKGKKIRLGDEISVGNTVQFPKFTTLL